MYSFVSVLRYGIKRVASFKAITIRPVAIGSSVPVCPAFFAFITLFTCSVNLKEVMPNGLETSKIRDGYFSIFYLYAFNFQKFLFYGDCAAKSAKRAVAFYYSVAGHDNRQRV